MVRINPDFERMKNLEKLQKERKAKEEELKKLEEEKKETLQDADRKLEQAVADLMVKEEELEPVKEEKRVFEEEGPNLEEQLESEKIPDVAGNISYEMPGLEQIGELYGQVKSELDGGNTNENTIYQAKNMLYTMRSGPTGDISLEDRERRDMYVNRLQSIVDIAESQSGATYKN